MRFESMAIKSGSCRESVLVREGNGLLVTGVSRPDEGVRGGAASYKSRHPTDAALMNFVSGDTEVATA
jgi:hypothetical protein